jgi:membrane protease YdiL (CAAX protease family)
MGLFVVWSLNALSFVVWLYVLTTDHRSMRLPAHERSQARYHPFVVLLAAAWVALQFAFTLYAQPQPTPSMPQSACVSQAVTWCILIALLWATCPSSLAEYGLGLPRGVRPLMDGVLAFAAAILPVTLILLATQRFRNVETQHPFFQVLRENPGAATIAWLALAVVVTAPLLEELIFRVVLQGWLQTRYPPAWAIGISAVVFAGVHGWPDVLPLLPLAAILGYLYWRRRSYASCVVAHALFNAMYLAIASLEQLEPTAPANLGDW